MVSAVSSHQKTGVGRSDRPAMKLTFEERKNVIQLFTQSFLETTVSNVELLAYRNHVIDGS